MMILLRTDLPIIDRNDVWCSEIKIRTLTPARRDKLVSLINSVTFTLRTNSSDILTGEIRDIANLYKMEN